MAPVADPMFPMGVGLVDLSATHLLPFFPKWVYTALEGVAMVACLVWYWRICKKVPEAAMLLAVLPLFFAWLSFASYFYCVAYAMFIFMTLKKESNSSLYKEENAQLKHSIKQFHRIADKLHASTNKEETEAALSEINNLGEATQAALLKALSKEHESDAADIALALNELSPNKSVRKEARRTLIRMEEARLYPQWKPPVVRTPVASIPVSHPPRFWRGYITQAREEGEIQLILCWEQGFDYGDVRMFIF